MAPAAATVFFVGHPKGHPRPPATHLPLVSPLLKCTYWLAGHLFTQNSVVSSVDLLFYRDIIHFQTHLYAFMNADEQKGYIQLAHHPSM